MLDVLPAELSLNILSYLPIPSLCSLFTLSRRWHRFLFANQSSIFHRAAILRGYTQPGLQLEDALARYTGSPWEGSIDWKDFCRRFFQLDKNWEGKGRAVARLLSPPGHDVHRIKVDEKAGICITTHIMGGLSVTHLFSSVLLWDLPPNYVRICAHCEYESGYLVFDRVDGWMEVWRLTSDADVDEVAIFAPPDEDQLNMSAFTAARHSQYAPRGHFRPWAKLSFPELTHAYRLSYPTLVCASLQHAYLFDVRTGSLVQTIDINITNICYVDVNERHVFICEPDVVHVCSRAGGTEVLRILNHVVVEHVDSVKSPNITFGDSFVSPLSLSPGLDDSFPDFIAAHVSRDAHDLVILASHDRILLVPDFESICRKETTLKGTGYVLRIPSEEDMFFYLGFEYGRVCVATLRGLYVFTLKPGPSVKAVFVRLYDNSQVVPTQEITCMQLTDRRVYFTWEDATRRDFTLFEDDENARELSPPITPPLGEPFHAGFGLEQLGVMVLDPLEGICVGCIDFSLMPEN